MRRLFTPRWIAGHLIALLAVVAFINFGFWQLRRLEERRDFNAEVEAGMAQDPIAVAGVGDDYEYRPVVAAGVFDGTFETLVLRANAGVSGYHVLTPLVLADGSALLVDRGWVPLEHDAPGDPAAAPPTGEVTVTGVLWPPESTATPGSLPPILRRIDPGVVGAFAPYSLAEPYLVLATQDPVPGALPVPVDLPELTQGPHLSYAGQWFLFSAIVIVGYPLLLRRVVRRGAGG